MPNLPEHYEYAKLVYVQLHLCLRALDAMGMNLPAAHLDATIQAMREEIANTPHQPDMDQTLAKDFGEIDALISRTWPLLGAKN